MAGGRPTGRRRCSEGASGFFELFDGSGKGAGRLRECGNDVWRLHGARSDEKRENGTFALVSMGVLRGKLNCISVIRYMTIYYRG